MPFNTELFFQIFSLGQKFPFLDNLIVFTAQYLIYFVIASIFILAIKGGVKEKKALLVIILSLIFAEIIIKIFHLFYVEPRPFVTYNLEPLIKHLPDASFPSEHTTAMATVAFSYYFYRSKWTLLFLILMVSVGFARIFVGVHYPLDIVGGIALGFISVSLVWLLKSWLKTKIFNSYPHQPHQRSSDEARLLTV